MSIEEYFNKIHEICQNIESSTSNLPMDVEKYFEIMNKINQEERNYISDFPEGLNNLSHEDTMGEFYYTKNKIAEAFIKECATLSPQELEEMFKNHSVSYEIQPRNGHVINDRMTISLDGDNYFTIFPSRVQDSEALLRFIQNVIPQNDTKNSEKEFVENSIIKRYISVGNPILSGNRTAEEIAGAYQLRKQVKDVKSTIVKEKIDYCRPEDIADYIQECCESRSWLKDDIENRRETGENVEPGMENGLREYEIMLSVLQRVHLSDQGVSMPSDVQVANIISSYDRGEIDLETMVFGLTNVTGLYRELHTTEEVMEAFGVSEQEAEEMFEEEGFETVSYNEHPYSTYLIVQNGIDMITDGFVTEDSLTEEQQQILNSVLKSNHSIEEIANVVSDRRPENINQVVSEISEEMKDNSKENGHAKGE